MLHRMCIKRCRYLPGKVFRSAFPLFTFQPDPSAGDKRGVDCRHLSESRFKCYVAFWMKGDVSKGLSRLEAQRRRDSC